MAATPTYIVTKIETRIVRSAFKLVDIANDQQPPIRMNLQLECNVLTTSWNCLFEFQKETDTGIISSSITLKRDDSTDKPVYAYVWVHANSTQGNIRNCFLRFEGLIEPGMEFQGFVSKIAQFSSEEKCVVSEIDMRVIIKIDECYSEGIQDSASGTAGNDIDSNMMMILPGYRKYMFAKL